MSKITQIWREEQYFSLSEAKALLPLVERITNDHYRQLVPVQEKLNMMLSNDPRRLPYERAFEEVVSAWKKKMDRLGLTVKGLWVVEFEVGDGHLNWRFPELKIGYFRPRNADLSQRIRLSKYIEEQDPDWAY
jgi:hypothetical protein